MGPGGVGALSGLLAALALPPFHLWPLAFLALVPLVRVLGREDTTPARAVGMGLAFGAAFYLPLTHWMPATLHGLIPAGALVGFLGMGILVGIAGLQVRLVHWLLQEGRAAPVLAVPGVWVTAEFLVARAGPVAFPWTPLGLSLASVPPLAAPAELGGVAALTLWITAVNGWVGGARKGGEATGGGPLMWTVVLLLLLAVPAGWGVYRVGSLERSETAPVELVALDLDRETLLDPERRDLAAGRALERAMAGARGAAGAAPVVSLLPEAPFAAFWEEGAEARFRGFATDRGVPLMAGTRFRVRGRPRNGVILLGARGREVARHGKVRLVPAAEWPELAPGPDRGALEVAGLRIGTLICFEMGFGSRARALVRDGAHLLSNPTLDAWLRPVIRGEAGSAWSPAHAQHRAHLVLRAVETRRGAVRAPIGGELLVVGPTGGIRELRPIGFQGAVTVTPRTTGVTTWFVRFGDLGGVAGLLILGALVARARMPGTGLVRE